jgi:acetyl/propionyl-CoA carboxylase alpha subunit
VFYDSMIAKLVAWAEDRPRAIARMARALSEYQVLGIRTTIPFFQWLMQQPEYHEGRYDTTYLDRLLAARGGRSFTEPDAEADELVTIAAAIDAWFRASAAVGTDGQGSGDGASLWLRTARAEAIRG